MLFALAASCNAAHLGTESAAPFQVASASDSSIVAQLKVDGRTVYFSETTRDRISAVPLSGGSPTMLATTRTNIQVPFGTGELAVDPDNVYYLDGANLDTVPRSGGATSTLATGSPGSFSSGLAIYQQDLYWMSTLAGATGDLYHVAAGGSTAEVVASGLSAAAYAAVDASNYYWVTTDASSINRVPRTGGTVVVLATSPNKATSLVQTPGGLAIGADSVYWTTNTACGGPAGAACPPQSDAGSSVNRVPLGGGSVEVLATDSAVAGIAVDAKNVYWVNPNQSIKWLPVEGDASFPHGRVLVADDLAYLGPVLSGGALYWASGNGLVWTIKGMLTPAQ